MSLGLTLTFAAVLLSGITVATGPAAAPIAGSWGGQHISLELTPSGGEVEYDCAHGTVGKIVPDPKGRFDVAGTHVHERGGPIRRDEAPASLPVRFAGLVEGDEMELTVTSTADGEVLGTFRLRRGRPARLMKCK